MNQWKRLATTSTIEAHRTGWPGVWDAFLAAISGNPRLTVPQEMTVSLWVMAPDDQKVRLLIAGPQLKAEDAEPKP